MTALWIRADASPSIGLGHVMRMSALAHVAAASLPVRFVVVEDEPARRALRARGFEVQTPQGPADDSWVERVEPTDVVVFDGYDLREDTMLRVRERGAVAAALDDLGDGDLPVDLAISPGAPDGAPGGARLSGPRYALVRPELVAYRRVRGGDTEQLLVTLGGTDATGASGIVLAALEDQRAFDRVALLVGPGGAAPSTGPSVEVVQGGEIAPIFDGASAAVSAAGNTAWELLCMGVPIAVVEVAPNQRGVARAIASADAGVAVGSVSDLATTLPGAVGRLADVGESRRLSEAGLELVDGLGPRRVLDELLARVRG